MAALSGVELLRAGDQRPVPLCDERMALIRIDGQPGYRYELSFLLYRIGDGSRWVVADPEAQLSTDALSAER